MRNNESFAIGISGVALPKLLKSATWPCRIKIMDMPAVSPSATDCFMRTSSASSPAFVNPRLVGSATACCGHAGDDEGACAKPGAAIAAAKMATTERYVRRLTCVTAILQQALGRAPRVRE